MIRYVVIPDEIARERPFGTFFKNYELVMHNYTAIFLALDLFHSSGSSASFPSSLESSTCCFPTLTHGYRRGTTFTPSSTLESTWLQVYAFVMLLLACCLHPVECGLALAFIVLFRRQVKDSILSGMR